MAMFNDGNDSGDFTLGSYYGGGVSTDVPQVNLTGSDASVYDEDEDPNKPKVGGDGRNVLTGDSLLSMFGPIAAPQYVNPWQGKETNPQFSWLQTDPSQNYYQSSNGTILNTSKDANGNTIFTDTYDNPTGSSHDKADVTYRIDPTTGQAIPTSATNRYQGSDWTSTYRLPVEMAAVIGTGALASGALAGAGAGGAAGGGAGLSSADLAAIYGPSGYGAGGASLTTAGDVGGLAGLGTGAENSFAAQAGGMVGAPETSGLSSADLQALYGNEGYGSTSNFSLSQLGNSAGKGALVNGGMTAVRGGTPSDILKGAAIGAVGGGLSYGIGSYNPAGAVGITDPNYQSIVNRGITGGASSAIGGGNPLVGAAMGSGTQAGNIIGGNLWNQTNGGTMPDYGMSTPDTGSTPVADWFNQNNQQSAAPVGFTSDLNSSLGRNTDSSAYNPDFSTGVAPTQQSSNPFKSSIQTLLGFGAGGASGTPKFGDMAGSLMGLWNSYQQKKRLSDLRGGLQDMFSPNSAYAQQLGQQLARRDAASGRRSQYGPRSVELQARLAQMNSQNAPQIASLINGEHGATDSGLWSLGRFLGQSGAYNGIGNAVSPYLAQMFNSPMGQPNVGPQYEG